LCFDAGTTLGPYETVAAIGAGATGEVYQARAARPRTFDRVATLVADALKARMMCSPLS
jgi:hypothetical protein